ncbi:cation diffusion facilitator family transporter [Murdochiella massiliensis]|uniref:cation diffusion facilitator family transporter n=1 Tax=Murdochiella massiliensis TaxID=1673723 RepID=UPI000833AF5C|nr:cation diffusion facilitator family transporter [Murdochiella massiliensis]
MNDALKQKKIMQRRQEVGRKGSLLGIVANAALAGTKMIIGLISGALSIFGDGVNNLFDALSSFVSLLSFYLAEKPEDREHPFGHARVEYMGSFFIAIMILYVAISLFLEGIKRIVNPVPVQFSTLQLILLLLSIGVKLAMAFLYSRWGKRYHSNVFLATAADAKSDILATSAILLALILSPVVGFSLDGPFTVVVAVLIGKNGIDILRANYDALLGKAPDARFVDALTKSLLSFPGVLGIHDMIVHDYGPGNRFVTVHVEVDGRKSAIESHELVDRIERRIAEEYQLEITIHMDPLQPRTHEVRAMEKRIRQLVQEHDERFSIHDFRLVTQAKGRNILFDVLIPWDKTINTEELKSVLEEQIHSLYPEDEVLITIDRDRVMRP